MKTATKKTKPVAAVCDHPPSQPAPELRQIKLALIDESKTNPRTEFPAELMAELQASIAAKGIEEALTVRPLPNGRFELVKGARRTRCARSLRLDTVPCIVKPLSDAECQEEQFTAFLAQGLSDLEEARTLKRLLELQPGATLDERIAALEPKTGKKRATILARLTILKVNTAAQGALTAGKISQSHCQIIAGIVPHLQDEFTKRVLKGRQYGDGTPFSVRETEELANREYRVNLKDAPFKLDDAALCAKAGACEKCPKKQNPNICTDPPCFANKRELHFKAVEAAATKNGQKVLSEKEWSAARYSSRYVQLDEDCWETSGKSRPWRALVKGAKPMLARDERKGLIEILPKDQALAAAKANGVKFDRGTSAVKAESPEAKKKRLFAIKLEQACTDRTALAVLAAVEKAKDLRPAFLAMINYRLVTDGGSLETALKRRGLAELHGAKISAALEKLEAGQLVSLLLEDCITHSYQRCFEQEYVEQAAADLKVDANGIRKQVVKELAAAEKKPAQSPAKAAPVAKAKKGKAKK